MKPIHLAALASCLLAACDQKQQARPTAAESSGPELTAVFANSPKEDAQQIHIARTTAKPGDEITLAGRIMGSEAPFVGGRAVFTLGDPTILQACNDKPGDNCETPWDNCCNTKEEKKSGLATIQVLDAGGRVLKQEIENVGGLVKLGKVTVTGKVADHSSPESLVVNATAIRVEP